MVLADVILNININDPRSHRVARPAKSLLALPWVTIGWVSALLAVCYGPIHVRLVAQWATTRTWVTDFSCRCAPAILPGKSGINRGLTAKPNWWGLAIMLWAALQLYIATLGAEIFLAAHVACDLHYRVGTPAGRQRSICGYSGSRSFFYFSWCPSPPLSITSSRSLYSCSPASVAENSITILQIPVIREGNVLELARRS